MKRFLTLLAAVLVAALPALRAADYEPTAASRDSREYQLRGFDGLNIGWTYKVELNCASRYGVTVEAPDFIFPYLKVEVRNGILVLDTKELPRDIRPVGRRNQHDHVGARKFADDRRDIVLQDAQPRLMTAAAALTEAEIIVVDANALCCVALRQLLCNDADYLGSCTVSYGTAIDNKCVHRTSLSAF